MNCKHCGKPITFDSAFGWFHSASKRFRCSRQPQPDPQKYAEPPEFE